MRGECGLGGSIGFRADKPTQIGYIESFDGRTRAELLNESPFFGFAWAIAASVADYNDARIPRWITRQPHACCCILGRASAGNNVKGGVLARVIGRAGASPSARPSP
jgi:hypothetical protein